MKKHPLIMALVLLACGSIGVLAASGDDAIAAPATPSPTPTKGGSLPPPPPPPPPLPQTGPANCDADGDGHRAGTVACGGDDCDDHDPFRHPRSTEFCSGQLPDGRSAATHDEDCDPCTIRNDLLDGDGDVDQDGYPSSGCQNPWLTASAPVGCNLRYTSVVSQPAQVIGVDCDDANPWIGPGSQKCTADQAGVMLCGPLTPVPGRTFTGHGGAWALHVCPRAANNTAGRCVPQANGTGVCVN